MNGILRFFLELWHISLEASPYLLLGFGVATLMHRYIPSEWLIRLLGRGKFRPTVTAAAIGIPLPLCSCSVVPTALAIKKKGAPRGATLAFFISTPETGMDSILLTYGLMGPVIAIARPLAAGLSAVGAGWLLEYLPEEPEVVEKDAETARPSQSSSCCTETHDSGRMETGKSSLRPEDHSTSRGACCGEHSHTGGQTAEQHPKVDEASCGCSGEEAYTDSSCCHQTDSQSPGSRKLSGAEFIRRELHRLGHSFAMLFDDVAFWILLGLVLSALASAFLPDSLFESSFGQGWKGMALAVLVGVPIYVCATASTPLAAVMVSKGFSVGAALVFLLVGPATNIGTIAIVSKILGKWAVASYLLMIISVSVIFGICIDWLFPGVGLTWVKTTLSHEAGTRGIAIASAVVIWCLLVWRTWVSQVKG